MSRANKTLTPTPSPTKRWTVVHERPHRGRWWICERDIFPLAFLYQLVADTFYTADGGAGWRFCFFETAASIFTSRSVSCFCRARDGTLRCRRNAVTEFIYGRFETPCSLCGHCGWRP